MVTVWNMNKIVLRGEDGCPRGYKFETDELGNKWLSVGCEGIGFNKFQILDDQGLYERVKYSLDSECFIDWLKVPKARKNYIEMFAGRDSRYFGIYDEVLNRKLRNTLDFAHHLYCFTEDAYLSDASYDCLCELETGDYHMGFICSKLRINDEVDGGVRVYHLYEFPFGNFGVEYKIPGMYEMGQDD